jgi:hypothetical protein
MTDQQAISRAIIKLMQGVVYRESDEDAWHSAQRSIGPLRDHFAAIGVDVVIDDIEGYAYLRSRPESDEETPLPRLVHRRSLSYPLSLLLVLLRKRLMEFETTGGTGRLVLSTDEITGMLQVFQAETSNEARLADQAEATIKKAVDHDFLSPVRGELGQWEVRRILKAYVDAETLQDFAAKLNEYARGARGKDQVNESAAVEAGAVDE